MSNLILHTAGGVAGKSDSLSPNRKVTGVTSKMISGEELRDLDMF